MYIFIFPGKRGGVFFISTPLKSRSCKGFMVFVFSTRQGSLEKQNFSVWRTQVGEVWCINEAAIFCLQLLLPF